MKQAKKQAVYNLDADVYLPEAADIETGEEVDTVAELDPAECEAVEAMLGFDPRTIEDEDEENRTSETRQKGKTTMKTKIGTKYYGCGSIMIDDGTRIDVHMANNAGRGSDNVTLTLVRADVPRPAYTRQYKQADIIAQTRTSGWCGHWSLSQRVREELGLE